MENEGAKTNEKLHSTNTSGKNLTLEEVEKQKKKKKKTQWGKINNCLVVECEEGENKGKEIHWRNVRARKETIDGI